MSFNSSWLGLTQRSGKSPKGKQERRLASHRRIARFEQFEPRMMLSYTPLQIQTAYGYNDIMYGSVVGNGAGQTVAIIDPGDDANFVNSSSPNFSKSDLAKFERRLQAPQPAELQGDRRGWRTTPHVCQCRRRPR